MSTITRELAKLFRKITNSEIDAEGNAHVVLSPADSLLINNARIALASLEAEASGRNPVLAYADSYRNMANHGVESIPVWSVITDLERNIAPLFTAPPAPVSVPAAMEMDDDFDSAFEHGKAVGWNAYLAAMLQGAEPVTAAYKLPDGCCVMPLKLTAENGAKGALSGEFHVTNRIVCQSCAGEGCEDCNDEGGWDAEIPVSWDTIKLIHEAAVEACSLPAAPQQEAE
ncbi:hypothetical protein [Enterobacter kobei]|uniref:hypothetical protein n=1 Tax=Enterobacter kobei TaxID=208224 RepID=UPI003D6E5E4C